MARSSGLRERVQHALIATAGIFTLALSFWGVQTYQQSTADSIGSPYQVTPTQGGAPLTVTATYNQDFVVPPGEQETVDFDDLDDNVFVSEQYQADHGLTIDGTNGGRPITWGPSLAGTRCNGGTEASSQPRYLSPRIGDVPNYGGVNLSFDTPVFEPGMTLVSVGQSTVTITYETADGTIAETQTVGPTTGDESGACQKNPTQYSGSEPISTITVQSDEPAGGLDGYGIDDLIFQTTGGADDEISWQFGDGSAAKSGHSVTHTYTNPGTYQVAVTNNGQTQTVTTVTVAEDGETPSTLSVRPTEGDAPLRVTARFTGLLNEDEETVVRSINFDELGDRDTVTDTYRDSHGIEFSSNDGNPTIYGTGSSFPCSDGTEASSQPNFLVGPTVESPLTLAFDQPVTNPSVTLISVGHSAVDVRYIGANGSTLNSHTEGPHETTVATDPGSGACNRHPVSYSDTEGVKRIEIVSSNSQPGDEFGIDDVTFTETTGVSVSLPSWDFGDGSDTVTGTTATHTYTQAGTYTVNFLNEGSSQQAGTVTVTKPEEATAQTTLSTTKSIYEPEEQVNFTLTNHGPDEIQFASGAPFEIFQGSESVFAPISTASVESLAADDSQSWFWDQQTSDEEQVDPGNYIVAVTYSVGEESVTKKKAFTITEGDTTPEPEDPTFTVQPTSGTVPLEVSTDCTGQGADITVDFGDGTVVSEVNCPTSLQHTYTQPGTYTIVVRRGERILASQIVVVQADTPKEVETVVTTDDGKGKGAPSVLASTGSNLLVVLLIAVVLSGLISYFIIRRPFHGDQS